MYDYVTKELPQLVNANLPVDSSRVSVFGHSMGVRTWSFTLSG
jgi:S-formylglutathione hydrolase